LGDLYLHIQRTLTLVRCDNTKANLPKVSADERKTQAVYLPFRWLWVEQRAIVTIPQQGTGLALHDEILKIDGRPIADLVVQISPYIPFDGKTHWSRFSGISEPLEFMGGAVDHFGVLLWYIKPIVNLLVRSKSGETKELQLDRINFIQWTQLQGENLSGSSFKNAVTFERIDDNTAYVRIDTFVNYRDTVKPEDIYNPTFKAM
jgi:hypothetical protein